MLIEKWLLFYKASEPTDLTVADYEQLHNEIWRGVQKNTATKPVRRPLWPKIAITAAVLLVISFGIYWFNDYKRDLKHGVIIVNDIAPGKNKAYLTLANGERIALTAAANGKLAKAGGVQITKTKDGQLVYEISPTPNGKTELALNTIETPRGGQYQIHLQDGTKVWLNAASKLIYPQSFVATAVRKVQLSGEAYFEVAKDSKHPFIVETTGQLVKVLGTHFNINSYTNEGDTKTTLLEGSVQVSGPTKVILKPGEQAVLKPGDLKIRQVNTDNIIAWKNGEFQFANEPLESIMRKISRWYDVEVIFQNPELKNEIFSGGISRFELVRDVLKKLSLTEVVKFKIEGRRIFVMK